jgi:hypothetical protein
VRPSPAWERRRRRGSGVGDLNQCGARECACDGVHEAVRTRKVTTTASVGVGRDRGVAAGNAAEPGSTPRVAASTAPAVGSRVCVPGSAGGKVCSWRPRKRCLSPSPMRPCARGTRPRRGRDGAAVLNAAASPTREKRDQGPALPPGSTCARAGVHDGARAPDPRGLVHERECEREPRRDIAITSGTARRTTVTRRS